MRNLLPFLLFLACSAHSQALKQTQDLLKDPTARQKAIDKDPKAKDVDDKVSALAGSSENKEEIYGLAMQLMEKLVADTNGDPQKMQALMTEAQKDPKAFYEKYFDAQQQAKTRGLANKIEKGPIKNGSQ